VNEEIANLLIKRAIEKARILEVNVCIAVVDDGAILTGFIRMDGAFKGSVDVAIGKARTSALFPYPTEQFGEVIHTNHLTGGSTEQDTNIAVYAIESVC